MLVKMNFKQIIIYAVALLSPKKSETSPCFWMHPINQRSEEGELSFQERRTQFFKYFRMSITTFDRHYYFILDGFLAVTFVYGKIPLPSNVKGRGNY